MYPAAVVTLGFANFQVEVDFIAGRSDIGAFRDVATLSDGTLVTAHDRAPHLHMWDPDGSYEGPLVIDADLIDVHAVSAGRQNSVWVVDRGRHVVREISADGHVLRTIGNVDRPAYNLPLNQPASVHLGADGNVLIGDGYGNRLVHRFSPDGVLLSTFSGMPAGSLSNPHAVITLDDGTALIADKHSNRLLHCDRKWELLGRYDMFYRPAAICLAMDHILVLDEGPSLTAMNRQLKVVGRCQPVAIKGHGMDVDLQGNILIAEPGTPTGVSRLRAIG